VLFNPATMAREETGLIAAGTQDTVLTFESRAGRQTLRSQLVDSKGVPAVGVQVSAWCSAFRVGLREEGSISSMHTHPPVTSDSTGEVFLGELVLDSLGLWLVGDDWISQRVDCTSGTVPAKIVMERALPLAVELSDPDVADQFGILDENGEGLPLIVRSPGRERVKKLGAVVAARSDRYLASENARECVLFLKGEEVSRMPIQFQAEGVTRLGN